MARQKNDGRGRLGGRQAGTPNKPLEPLAVWVAGLIDKNRKQFEKDLAALEPQRRAAILGGLIASANQATK